LQQQQPVFVSDAEAAVAVLRHQFDVVVDPDGTLIHARRKITSTSDNAVFEHCRPVAALGMKHHRLERLLEVRARLELTRLVAEQVDIKCHMLNVITIILSKMMSHADTVQMREESESGIKK